MNDGLYIVREKLNFNLMNDDDIHQHKKQQKQQINKKYYHKKKQTELYYKESYKDICDAIIEFNDNCSKEDMELFLECKKICEEWGVSSVQLI